eukprot:124695-Hanusia_phi.AAC.1
MRPHSYDLVGARKSRRGTGEQQRWEGSARIGVSESRAQDGWGKGAERSESWGRRREEVGLTAAAVVSWCDLPGDAAGDEQGEA